MGLETQLGGPWQLYRGIEKKSKVRNLGSKIHYQTKKEGNFILSAGKRKRLHVLPVFESEITRAKSEQNA